MDMTKAVAVVGIGCRFPGADSPEEYWRLLFNCENHIQEVPDDRWSKEQFYSKARNEKGKTYTTHAGTLKEDIRMWDNKPFGINTMEAELMDPQQRLALETSYRACEDGGFTLEDLSDTNTAVYMGVMTQDYQNLTFMDPTFLDNYSATGTTNSILSNRLSYFYNLHGPSVTVDTACSSGLVAVNLGAQSILSGQSDMAMCGGVSCILSPSMFVALSKARMASEKGQCHTFSENADGYVRSEGCGVVILKNIEKAMADGNKIWGIVTSACNSDGKASSPITSPASAMQAELIERTLKQAGVQPEEVQFVEMHGTGTPVGDPVETSAIGQVIGAAKKKQKSAPVPVGSVKTNIGHLEAAAGLAGLIKVLLMMKHQTMVPSVIFGELKESLNLAEKHIEVLAQIRKWESLPETDDNVRIVAVNSFGFGGTNVHLVAEMSDRYSQQQILKQRQPCSIPGSRVVLFTGIDAAVIRASIADTLREIKRDPSISLDSIAHTSCHHRTLYPNKLAFVINTLEELQTKLESALEGTSEIGKRVSVKEKKNTVFVFCGMGTHWENMGKVLYEKEPVYRDTIDQLHFLFQSMGDFDLKQCLAGIHDLSNPRYGQPSIFACQVALFHLWKSKGVSPDVIVGHSVGEVAAAYASGNICLEDAVFVIYHRGRIVGKASDGGMLAIGNIPLSQVQKLLEPYQSSLEIAAANSPTSCTISGSLKELEQLQTEVEAMEPKPFVRRLAVKVAYHSRFMEPILQDLCDTLSHIQLKSDDGKGISHISTVKGAQVENNEFITTEYWMRNVRQTVLFNKAMQETLLADSTNVVIEIGPKPALKTNIKEIAAGMKLELFASMAASKDGMFYSTLGKIYELGAFQKDPGTEVLSPVPRYVFQRAMLYREPEIATNLRRGLQEIQPHCIHPFVFPSTDKKNVSTCKITPKTANFVFEHKLRGNIIVPGATYVEMGFAGISLAQDDELSLNSQKPVRIKVNFNQVCMLKNESATTELKVSCHKNDSGGGRYFFDVTSGETVHATGFVCMDDQPHTTRASIICLEDLRKHHTFQFDEQFFYDNLEKYGFTYGSSLRCVQQGSTNYRDSLITLVVPDGTNLNKTFFHPAVLDSILQSGILFTTSSGLDEGDQMLPYGIREVSLYRKLCSSMLLHMRSVKVLDHTMEVDAVLADMTGVILAECKGITYGVVGKHMNFDVEQNIFTPSWKPYTMPLCKTEKDDRYLVFYEEDCTFPLDSLKSHITPVALTKKDIEAIGRNEDGVKELMPADISDYKGILYFAGFRESQPPIEDINGKDMDGIIQSATFTLLQFVKILSNLKEAPPMFAITAGVFPFLKWQRVSPDQRLEALIGVTVNAFCRTVNKELPAFQLYSLDISDLRSIDMGLVENIISTTPMFYELVLCKGKLFHGTLDVAENTSSSASRVIRVTNQDDVKVYYASQNEDAMILKPENQLQGAQTSDVSLNIESIRVESKRKQINRVGDDNRHMSTKDGIATTNENKKYHVCQRIDISSKISANKTNLMKWNVFPCDYPTLSFWLTSWKAMKDFKRGQTMFILEKNASPVWGLVARSLANLLHLRVTDDCSQAEIVVIATDDLKSVVITDIKPAQFVLLLSERYTEVPNDMQLPNMKTEYNVSIFPADKIAKQIQKFKAWLQKIDKKKLRQEMVAFNKKMREISDIFTLSDFSEIKVSISPRPTFVLMQMNGRTIQMVADNSKEVIRQRAGYLVVGGRTGLGWETVKYLIKHGAKYIGIVSRSGIDAQTKAEVNLLEEQNGCRIVDLIADTCSISEVTEAVATFQQVTNVQIKGVFYGAAVTCDSIIPAMTLDKYMKALSPKVAGVWNIYHATKHMDLDIFTMFSSITSLFGNAGQTNYATGNAFKDAVACLRRIETGVGQSICWGALDLGILSDNQHARRKVQVLGLAPMKVSEILSSMDHALTSNQTVVAYVKFIWPSWYRYLGTGPDIIRNQYQSLIDRFCHFVKKDKSDKGSAVGTNSKQEHIVEVLKKVAVLEDEDINLAASMIDLGADSQDRQKIYNIIMADIGFSEKDLSLIEMGDMALSDLIERFKNISSQPDQSSVATENETSDNESKIVRTRTEDKIKQSTQDPDITETDEIVSVPKATSDMNKFTSKESTTSFEDNLADSGKTNPQNGKHRTSADQLPDIGNQKQPLMSKSTPDLYSSYSSETKPTTKPRKRGLKAMKLKLGSVFGSKRNLSECSARL